MQQVTETKQKPLQILFKNLCNKTLQNHTFRDLELLYPTTMLFCQNKPTILAIFIDQKRPLNYYTIKRWFETYEREYSYLNDIRCATKVFIANTVSEPSQRFAQKYHAFTLARVDLERAIAYDLSPYTLLNPRPIYVCQACHRPRDNIQIITSIKAFFCHECLEKLKKEILNNFLFFIKELNSDTHQIVNRFLTEYQRRNNNDSKRENSQ